MGSFKLGDVLIKYIPQAEEGFKRFDVGSFKEKEGWHLLEPHGKGWEIKEQRPFLIVHLSESYAYLLFFSTSPFFFRCPEDERYGIAEETPEMDFDKCFINNPKCNWIERKAKIFKRRYKGGCRIVLRLGRDYLEELSEICGHCSELSVPDKIKDLIEEELRRWKIES
ncbi:MAG: hypothetical protein KNN13_04600 [Hydrogenobacter thermophilus]|uniref:hypothetical protein n=1 Tax=Hydrogenobacter thermophilus TaxID=940 RepID=UPI001C76BA88|nr:hypothetical protein [Hydrogenobacter thermophilus]QWK20602.1 MAG: hypothetical protein KNN13_04600 [Hydrogenobacter thermophilus]